MFFEEEITPGNRAEFAPIRDTYQICDTCGRRSPPSEEWASPLCPLCEAMWRAGLRKPGVININKLNITDS